MPDSFSHVTVTTTWPSEPDANRAAETLVTERLAACAQVRGPLQSTYRWRGAVEQALEWSCVLKTTLERYPALEQRVHQLHPYQVAEILATPILRGNASYLAWVEESVK